MKIVRHWDFQAMPLWPSWPRPSASRRARTCAWMLLPLLPMLATAKLSARQLHPTASAGPVPTPPATPRAAPAAGPAGAPTTTATPTGLPSAPLAAAPAPAGLGLLDSVRLMLANDPNLVLSRAHLMSAEGALSIQKGAFDTLVTGSVGHTETRTPVLDAVAQRETDLTVSFGLSQEFRSGLSITPEVDLSSIAANAALTGVSGVAASVNTGTVAFTLRQPLLRGRGSEVADAGERAARHEAEASALDLRHTISQRILSVASRYWTVVAAHLSLDILRGNEDSSRQLLATTRRLIAADVTAPAEAVQLEANLAAAEASRFAGQNALFKARHDLGREIGLDAAQAAALPLPADSFPALAPAALDSADAARFVAGALRHRADVQAARQRQQETGVLLVAAENALLPQLDLVLKPSYSGLMEGGGVAAFFAPLLRKIPGVSSSLSLNLSWPVRNDAAYGQLLESRATRQQSTALLDQLQKSIGTDVPISVDTVARSAQQLERAKQAVRLFRRAVANEERKLSAGNSTVLDVITQRDRLLAAEQTEVSAELSLALALAQLRFDTGTMVAESGGLESVDDRRITTVPAAEELSP
jgi:outer membrane protein